MMENWLKSKDSDGPSTYVGGTQRTRLTSRVEAHLWKAICPIVLLVHHLKNVENFPQIQLLLYMKTDCTIVMQL